MSVAFGGISKMLSSKKYPQNVRALRIIVEELLRKELSSSDHCSYSQLVKTLQDKVSRTQKLWIDNLIKPVFIIMLFIRAERGDWPLHLLATEMMLPYFFASGHSNCARYGLYYLRFMSKLPCQVLKEFASVYCQQTQHSLLVSGLLSVLRCN